MTLGVFITAASVFSYSMFFSLHLHTTYLYMKQNFWIQCRHSWHWVEYAINKNRRPQEKWTSTVLLFPKDFYFTPHCWISNCLKVSSAFLQLFSYSSSISPNELAPCCLTLWTPPACLHLWMTDVLFYIHFLGCLSLIHPRMSLHMLRKSDHCLLLVPFFYLFSFLPSAVGSMHWQTKVTYICSHIICITI